MTVVEMGERVVGGSIPWVIKGHRLTAFCYICPAFVSKLAVAISHQPATKGEELNEADIGGGYGLDLEVMFLLPRKSRKQLSCNGGLGDEIHLCAQEERSKSVQSWITEVIHVLTVWGASFSFTQPHTHSSTHSLASLTVPRGTRYVSSRRVTGQRQ